MDAEGSPLTTYHFDRFALNLAHGVLQADNESTAILCNRQRIRERKGAAIDPGTTLRWHYATFT